MISTAIDKTKPAARYTANSETPKNAFTVDVIDTFSGFIALKPYWDALHSKDPESGHFLSWSWLAAAFKTNPKAWRVFAVRKTDSENNYLCFFPTKYRVHWSRTTQKFQSEIEAGGRLLWSEYTGFICNPAFEDVALKALAVHLSNMPWVKLSLRYEPSKHRASLFAQAFSKEHFRVSWKNYHINKGQTDNLLCPQIALPKSYDSYLKDFTSANTRQKIKRFTRRHIDTGELRISFAKTADARKEIKILLDQWKQKWLPLKGNETTARVAGNYRQILSTSSQMNALLLPVLWRGDQAIGALGCILDHPNKHLCFIVAGRQENNSNPNIGLLLHAHTIRWAIENGFKTYDFGHGNEAYKYSFGAKDKQVKYFSIRRRQEPAQKLLDSLSTGQAMRRTKEFLETGKSDKALQACQQLATILNPLDQDL